MKTAAFTLIELVTVIVVISILAVMAVGIIGDVQTRANKASCIQNLKNLYVGANGYVQQYERWPQIQTVSLLQQGDTEYAKAWIAVLQPFGLTQQNWICPSVQRKMDNPDLRQEENIRVDYMATPFDNQPATPFLWPHQPWFAERAGMHEGGNLMIWTNGQIVTLKESIRFQ